MIDNDFYKALQFSKNILRFTSPLTWLVVDSAEMVIQKSSTLSDRGNLDDIKQEALKQEILLKMAECQAKVAQEVAIARRIDTAEEVIIEEYFDTTGAGDLGVKLEGESLSAGLSGSGRRVSKKVYTFKGWRDGGLEVIEKLTDKNE
ncbi:hypothetical protein SDC9_128840 [bioreactor metagenome]|uniref:Uncharacterized protein n=1 Tax=bioreactor metagenome TaxID=1076179 RepID=A0A645CY39_9ZZZZ|nr:hypothetical protein [Oscillospiraceae bacterium]